MRPTPRHSPDRPPWDSAASIHPTLEQLRAGAMKPDPHRLGNWMARRIARPLAIYVTWVSVRAGLSAHAMTLLAWATGLAAAVALSGAVTFGFTQEWSFVLGAALLQLWYLLDHVDGQIARWRRTASLDGVQLDYLMHHTLGLLVPLSVGAGLFQRSLETRWLVAALAWGAGTLVVGLLSDTRYKALFQRLKLVHGELVLVGGGGGRPQPPARPGRNLFRALSWLAQKSLEPQVVMNLLTAAAALLVAAPDAGWLVLKMLVGCQAATALLVAIRGVARSVRREEAESQFKAWFVPPQGATLEFENGWWFVRPAEARRSDPGAPAPRCPHGAGPPSPSQPPERLESS